MIHVGKLHHQRHCGQRHLHGGGEKRGRPTTAKLLLSPPGKPSCQSAQSSRLTNPPTASPGVNNPPSAPPRSTARITTIFNTNRTATMERQPVAERQLHWTLAIARKLGEIKTQDGKKRNPSRQNTGICQLLRARERAALVALRKSQAPVPRIGPARIAHQRKVCGSALETKWYCDSSLTPGWPSRRQSPRSSSPPAFFPAKRQQHDLKAEQRPGQRDVIDRRQTRARPTGNQRAGFIFQQAQLTRHHPRPQRAHFPGATSRPSGSPALL